jgi:hypothetical protein
MPNWCYNNLDITATTDEQKAMLERVSKAEAADGFIGMFLPLPEALKETTSPTPQPGQANYKGEQPLVDGFDNWYDWQVANWGTKWDPEVMSADFDGTTLSVSFDSAWSPPVAFYEWLSENGYEVSANYYEPGMDFGGFWVDGDDNFIEGVSEIAREDEDNWSDDFRELDAIYGIAEEVAMWDEDEDLVDEA